MTPPLDEAYDRFQGTGPEWGGNLSNHGPMAAEVLSRRGYDDEVDTWVSAYLPRLDELPRPTEPITSETWQQSLGDFGRVGDWTDFFRRELADHSWRTVLATWWPRLLPGIAAGATHGLIRTSHATRTLLGGDESPAATAELGSGLAFWAARHVAVPGAGDLTGELDPQSALDAVPALDDQSGPIAGRLGRLAEMPGWPDAVSSLRPPDSPDDVVTRLEDLVTAATRRYLHRGHGSPVLLVHTATAPNAVLHTLPALPQELWAPSLGAAWAASAAITATYAPTADAPRGDLPDAPRGDDPVPDLLDQSVRHGDEHVIKFTDTAVEVYQRTGDPDALAAAVHIQGLISANE